MNLAKASKAGCPVDAEGGINHRNSFPHKNSERFFVFLSLNCCGNLFFVGVPGFEPGTSCSQSRHTNRTVLHPETHFVKRGHKSTIYSSILKTFKFFYSFIPI